MTFACKITYFLLNKRESEDIFTLFQPILGLKTTLFQQFFGLKITLFQPILGPKITLFQDFGGESVLFHLCVC